MRAKVPQQLHDNIIDVFAARRKELGLSHEKLANLAGLHRTAISHIESRRRNPTLLVCLKLAQALGYRLSEIIAAAESKMPENKRR